MNRIYAFVAFFPCLTALFANNPTTLTVAPRWHEAPDTIWTDGQMQQRLTFDGAVLDEQHPEWAFWQAWIEVSGPGTLSARWTEATFEPVPSAFRPRESDLPKGTIDVQAQVWQQGRRWFGHLLLLPVRRRPDGTLERLVHGTLEVRFVPAPATPFAAPRTTTTSALADGAIYKIAVSETGMHRIDYDLLQSLGIDLAATPADQIKLLGAGGGMLPEVTDEPRVDDLPEIPYLLVDGGDNHIDPGDYLLFYAEGPSTWHYDSGQQRFTRPTNVYDTRNYYFLKISSTSRKALPLRSLAGSWDYSTTTFDDFARFEEERTNLMHDWVNGQGSGRRWFGDLFKLQLSQNYTFTFPGIRTDEPAWLHVEFVGRIFSGSARFRATVAGATFSSETFSTTSGGTTDRFASLRTVDGSFLPQGEQLDVTIEFVNGGNSSNEGWLDFIELNVRRDLVFLDSELRFQDARALGHQAALFRLRGHTSDLVVWDVTDPLAPARIEGSVVGDELRFAVSVDERVPTFVAFRPNAITRTPEAIGPVPNQNLHGMSDVDMVIVTHADFMAQAQKLAQHRAQHNDIEVAVVDVEQVYNEFSSGRRSATAIRDFARMLHQRTDRFRWLLLFGDGSFDNRDLEGLGGNWLPVYETHESLAPINAFPSDDFFTLLSDGEGGPALSGLMDIAVGRIPVNTPEQAQTVVDKIIRYDTDPEALGDWRLRAAFVGDDEDGGQHTNDADETATKALQFNPDLNLEKIYLDAFPQVATPGGTRVPLATEALRQAVFKGVLTVVYFGHGGAKGWAQERVLKIEDIRSWENPKHLPVFITATCSFAGYDNPVFTSAGEELILHERGGAACLLTTVRAVYANSNKRLTQSITDTLYIKRLDGARLTLGEVMVLGKNFGGAQTTNSRKFTLMGDPAMWLALPHYDVVTTRINGRDVAAGQPDTLRALQKVTIEGYVAAPDGSVLEDFNGILYPTIFDKAVDYRTLGQGTPVRTFRLQKNVLFKGRASVVNGRFQFTFVVPKDIDYAYGPGKISYYAAETTSLRDASGSYSGIVVGGTDPNALADTEGPRVDVYLNSTDFAFGGITDPDPVLLVVLSDDNGINVTGNSIGHDLAATLDDNTQQTFLLNDFYEAALDDYTRGEVRYPLSKLEEGRHSVRVRAWDVANNSSEGYTEFVVVSDAAVALEHVLNYPNPFTTRTCFTFEHNLPGRTLDVRVDIYTVSGQLVKTLEGKIFSEGSRLGLDECLEWDGTDDFGDRLARGVYLYKVHVRDAEATDGAEGSSRFEKLVILK